MLPFWLIIEAGRQELPRGSCKGGKDSGGEPKGAGAVTDKTGLNTHLPAGDGGIEVAKRMMEMRGNGLLKRNLVNKRRTINLCCESGWGEQE